MDKVIAILKEQQAHYGLNAALKTERRQEYESAVEEIELALQMLQLNKHGVMRSLLDEVNRVSSVAQQKLVKLAERPMSEEAIECRAILMLCEHMLGFILSNDA